MALLKRDFPDIEATVCEMLEGIADTFTMVPESVPDKFILVRRIGGPDDGFQDYPVVDVQCVALHTSDQTTPRDVAHQMARDVQQVALASRRTVVGDVLVDDCMSITPPCEHPDVNTDARVVAATYEFTLRRPFRH